MASHTLAEAEVESFITKLKQSDTDKKVDLIQSFGLKLENVDQIPVTALDAITLSIAPLLKSTSQLLYNAVLTSFIPFYIPLLPASPPNHIHLASSQLLPSLTEKLNDARERTHGAARLCVGLIGKKCYEVEHGSLSVSSTSGKGKEREGLVGFWERAIKETMGGKGGRAKIECMRMLLVLRQNVQGGLPLKPWLAPLVDLLEDGDGNVRDQARETVVALVAPSSTPAAAKSEIKKLLQARNIRRAIAEGIISRIFSSHAENAEVETEALMTNSDLLSTSDQTGDPPDIVHVGLKKSEKVFLSSSKVASGKDLEEEFARMSPYFEGKETEHNWASREKSLMEIRGLLRGKAYAKFPEAFLNGLRAGIINGITRTLLSLRTTVAQQSCTLVQELAKELRGHFDPFVEQLLPTLGKMAGFTKKIIAEKSQVCMTAIITHSTCHPRLVIAHISDGIVDKNVQIRQYCVSHLRTFIDLQGQRFKVTIEGVPTIMDGLESGIRRSLVDVNPLVREQARLAFWSFHSIWPARATNIMSELDSTARKQLDKVNPSTEELQSTLPVAPPTKKPPIRSAMAALLAEKRKAKAAEIASVGVLNGVRAVSSPVPNSPLLDQRARANSSTFPNYDSACGHTMLVEDDRSDSMHASASQAISPLRTPSGAPAEALSPAGTSANDESIGHSPKSPSPKTTELQPDQDLLVQAGEAELTARALLDVDIDQLAVSSPITPRRDAATREPTTGTPASYLLKTPSIGHRAFETPARAVWDDSPRPEAMTPLLFAQLKEKKHERTWWLKRQELMDKASPLRSRPSDATSAVDGDIRELEKGQPSLRNLQKLALFSETHPFSPTLDDSISTAESQREEALFNRTFAALTDYLEPHRPIDLLEQALVLLWEMVRNQWSLFKDREDTLVDSLFRLRACAHIVIHESVNSLMSLLCEVSEAVFLLSVIRLALIRYLERHTADDIAKAGQYPVSEARCSGFLFGLTALGRCALRIPPAVLRIEVPPLAPLVSEALAQESMGPRKAAHTLILAVQAVMNDAQETMDLLDLTEGQRDFAFYMLAKNKLWTPVAVDVLDSNEKHDGDEREHAKVARVKEEMDGLLGRGGR